MRFFSKISNSKLVNNTKYVKKIDLKKEISITQFSLIKQNGGLFKGKIPGISLYNNQKFMHVADIIKDSCIKRKTQIHFKPKIPVKVWRDKTEWIYMFTVAAPKNKLDKIVKIGGTRNGLAGRSGSYLSGHYTGCSSTNAYIYNTFKHYISSGYKIKMFGYNIPKMEIKADVFGRKITVQPQIFHSYESVALEMYKEQNGSYPVLSNNCDPEYRILKKK
jgi:hypothetical protein